MTACRNLRIMVLLLGLSVVASAHAEGEGATTLFKSIPQSDEILDALGESSNATGETHKSKQRSLTKPGTSSRAIKVISNTTPPPTPATSVAAPTPTGQSATAQNNKNKVAFPLTFDINSATLTSEAERYLDSLAKALQEKPNLNLQISGHTDTSGGDDINLPLSLQRAEAVKQYLSSKHHIDPARLTTSGAGSRQLLFKDNPRAQANRRVEFVKNN